MSNKIEIIYYKRLFRIFYKYFGKSESPETGIARGG